VSGTTKVGEMETTPYIIYCLDICILCFERHVNEEQLLWLVARVRRLTLAAAATPNPFHHAADGGSRRYNPSGHQGEQWPGALSLP
jgi:hypothetical protein